MRKRNFKRWMVTIMIVVFSLNLLQAQTNRHFGTLDIGFDLGMHIANKYNAKFYDGSKSNVNNLNFILGNKFQYNDIKNVLNCSDTFFLSELPTNMRYNTAFAIGFYLRKTFDNYTGINLQINVVKLRAEDVFSIEVDPNSVILSNKDLRLFPIWGVEERYNFDLSFSKYIKQKNKAFIPFFEAGINLNNTKVKEHKIKIEGLEYSLVNVYLNGSYNPGAQQNEYDVRQGGIGWGAFISGGYRIQFNKVILYPGLTLYMQKINLEQFNAVKPSFELNVKMSLSEVLFGESTKEEVKIEE